MARHHRTLNQPVTPRSPAERAHRLRRRGNARKAMLVLREAAQLAEHEPKLWTLFGVHAGRLGKAGEAREALTRAVWLRERARQHGRAAATRKLLAELLDGCWAA